MKYAERRSFTRASVDCEMTYRLVDSHAFQSARCISISGSGLAFITSETQEEGKAIEVSILPQNPSAIPLTAFVEVLRCKKLESGDYEIAAIIKSIKG